MAEPQREPAADLPPEDAGGRHAAAEAAAAAAREVFVTTKKRDAVVVNGFVMIKHFVSSNGRIQYWRCELVNKMKCNARGESVAGTTAVVMREKYNTHNHDPDATALKVRKLQNDVKDQAKRQQMSSAAVIVDHALRGADEDVVMAMPRDNLLRLVSNARRLEGARQVNRPAVADVVFPDAFKNTALGDAFLLFDSRTTQPGESVIFIFSSAAQLRELRRRQHWAVDGTFYCTPTHFDSVFTVHTHIGHSSVPVAYFLLQDRKETTYRRALEAFVVSARIQYIQPASIMSDFELAAINALRAVFPMSAIRLCLFHLAQAAFKNIAEHGLVRLYRDNARAQEVLRCFPALAALPPEDVVKGLEVVVAEVGRMQATNEIAADWDVPLHKFEDYFEKTYVRAYNRVGDDFVEPRYPIVWWNHYHSIINNLHRTNNAVEGKYICWHHAFNNTFASAHMALDKFIYRLQNDEDITRQKLLRQEVFAAEPVRRRRQARYLAADKHLLALAQRYPAYRARDEPGILRYLRCVQYHLHKPRFPGEPANVDEDPLEEVGNDDNGGNDGNAGVAEDNPEEDGARIPRRESHPGRVHGFEPEAAEEEEQRGVGQAAAAAPVADVVVADGAGAQQVNAAEDALPAFSQNDVVDRSQPRTHWGPVQLPSQSSSAAPTSGFVRRPAATAAPRRGPVNMATFNALTGYGRR